MESSASSTIQSGPTNHSCPWQMNWGHWETEPRTNRACRTHTATLLCISRSRDTLHPPLRLSAWRINPTGLHPASSSSIRETPAAREANQTWASIFARARMWTRPSAPWRAPCPGCTSRMCPTAWSALSTATAAGWPATAWVTTTTPSQGHSAGTPRGPVRVEEVITLIITVQCPASAPCAASAGVVTSRPDCPPTTTQHGAPAQLCLLITGSILAIFQRGSTSHSPPTDRATAYQGAHGGRAASLTADWATGPRAHPARRGRAWGASWAPSSLRARWSKSWMLTHTSQTCPNWLLSSRATGPATSPSRLETHFLTQTEPTLEFSSQKQSENSKKWKIFLKWLWICIVTNQTVGRLGLLLEHIPNVPFIIALKSDIIWWSLENVADWMLFLYPSIKVQCTTLHTCYLL